MDRKRPLSELDKAQHDWRTEAATAVLSGSLSAVACSSLVLKAQLDGAKGAEHLARAGKSGEHPGNASRDIRRCLMKGSLWPKFYYADIPVWDPKLEVMTEKSHPFLLPHEWLLKAKSICNMEAYSVKDGNQSILKHMQQVAAGLNCPVADFTPLGLHCDGVPFGSQVFYQDSLELFTLNLPCGPGTGMRIPFTSCQKSHLVKHDTYNAILGILAWSLKMLAVGTLPSTRHDGSPFGQGEQHRAAMAEKAAKPGSDVQPARALLVEIRADWVALKQVFQFPQQNENAGICWMCYAKPADIRDCSESASWRTNRRTAMSFHVELREAGKQCPLWSAPGCSSSIVVVDWLHCCDIGVAADVLGNVLWELLDLFPGGDRNVRMAALWSAVQVEYRTADVPRSNRFPGLRVKSFHNGKKSPKLKGKAAHIRGLVPILDRIVQRVMVAPDTHSQTVATCMHHLATCYSCIDIFNAQVLATAARKMALLYCSLEKEMIGMGFPKKWKVKPKLHLFLELCFFLCLQRQMGNPRDFWTYADETNGGTMKRIAVRRGGKNSSASSAYRMLSFWVAQTDLARL